MSAQGKIKAGIAIPLAFAGLLAGCAAPKTPDIQFAWRQEKEARVELRAVPALAPEFIENSRIALLHQHEGDVAPLAPHLSSDADLTFRPDAPSDKDWRAISRTAKGPAIIGFSLSFDLSEHTWTARTGLVKRGTRGGFTPQLVMSFDDLEF